VVLGPAIYDWQCWTKPFKNTKALRATFDKKGSKVRPRDFARALVELWRIRLTLASRAGEK